MRSESSTSDRTFTEQARRRQFVDCAIEVIAEHGFAQASLARIAAKAGTSKGVISYHFRDKDELIEQVLLDIYAGMAGFIGPRMAAAGSAAEKLESFLESNLEYLARHRSQLLAMRRICPNLPEPEEPAPHDSAVAEFLRAGQESGEFRDFDVTVMAVTIRAALDGALDEFVARPELDLAAYRRELVTLFTHATRGNP